MRFISNIFVAAKVVFFIFAEKIRAMKILSTEQIREADRYTIEHEPIASIDLMERAVGSLVPWLTERIQKGSKVSIFCGMGNNGGDGLALARLLNEKELVPTVYLVRYANKMTPDCETNYNRLKEAGKVPVKEVRGSEDFPQLERGEVVVDALFGTGSKDLPQSWWTI